MSIVELDDDAASVQDTSTLILEREVIDENSESSIIRSSLSISRQSTPRNNILVLYAVYGPVCCIWCILELHSLIRGPACLLVS